VQSARALLNVGSYRALSAGRRIAMSAKLSRTSLNAYYNVARSSGKTGNRGDVSKRDLGEKEKQQGKGVRHIQEVRGGVTVGRAEEFRRAAT